MRLVSKRWQRCQDWCVGFAGADSRNKGLASRKTQHHGGCTNLALLTSGNLDA